MQETLIQDGGNNVEIAQELGRKLDFRIRKSSTKFNQIKVKKPHFKLRKSLFKKGLESNCKSKYVLKFDIEIDSFFFKDKDV